MWAITGNTELGGKFPVEAAREGAPGLASAMQLVDEVVDRRRREERAAEAVAMARLKLEAAAAKVFQRERPAVYLKGPQPVLGGKSPRVYCVAEESIRKCIDLTLPGREAPTRV